VQVQHHPRYKKRIPCEFEDDQGRHLGMVLNVSQGGLFVSSRVTPKVGSRVVLHFAPDNGPRSTDVAARVVWKCKVHRSAVAIRDSGIGLEVEGDSDRYDALMQHLVPALAAEAEGAPEEATAATPTSTMFCVRAALVGTPRTRSVEVRAADDREASARVLENLGEGWQVIEVAPAASPAD